MSPKIELNMRVFKRTRKRPQQGDLFTFQMPDDLFRFGRVIQKIEDGRVFSSVDECYLIYIYTFTSPKLDLSPSPPIVPSAANLLVEPIITVHFPWIRGYFKTIDNCPVAPEEILDRHCFKRYGGTYVDERGILIDDPTEPIGNWGLSMDGWIDDRISRALGIPKVERPARFQSKRRRRTPPDKSPTEPEPGQISNWVNRWLRMSRR